MNNWKIEKNSPVPYYHQVERFIREEIDREIINKGDNLPSEGEIAEYYDVSISVVRQALERLERDKIISRRKGKKAKVIGEPKKKLTYVAKEISLYSELKNLGLDVKTKVLENKTIDPNSYLSNIFKLKDNEKLIKISRVRKVNNKPMIYWISYLPFNLCKKLSELDLTDQSLYEVLKKEFNLEPKFAKKSFEVIAASEYEGKILKIPVGAPLIYIKSTHYLEKGKVMEFYEAWQAANDWKFVL